MEPPAAWDRTSERSVDLQRTLLLGSVGLAMLGTWTALASAPVRSEPADERWRGAHPPALEKYEAACERGDARACNDLGVSHRRGHGTPQDDELALRVFERACRLGSAEACNNQGAILEQQWETGKDIGIVHDLYRHACDSGSALGCSNLGALYAKGKGVEYNRAEARWLFERACQAGGATGCQNLLELTLHRRPNQ
jgi:TPR repeat protein